MNYTINCTNRLPVRKKGQPEAVVGAGILRRRNNTYSNGPVYLTESTVYLTDSTGQEYHNYGIQRTPSSQFLLITRRALRAEPRFYHRRLG